VVVVVVVVVGRLGQPRAVTHLEDFQQVQVLRDSKSGVVVAGRLSQPETATHLENFQQLQVSRDSKLGVAVVVVAGRCWPGTVTHLEKF
jgi:hypothetical protein